uniref:Mannan-binding lectin isoform 1 n=1 Tax=Mesocentrotus nudus TaxID=7666 RepID=C8CBY8_MESNU|nr:mannan-binding lectin isoform 1 [Mesocentrotus nudus]
MNSNFTISLFLLAAIACLSEGCCPERFMQFGDWCFHYNSDKVNWHDARHACERLGAHLVSIHSLEDSREVYVLWKSLADESHTNDVDRSFWIGLHDLSNENFFEWSDGTPLNYSLWYPGEPNDSHGEDCVAPYNHGSNDSARQKWHDYGCEHRLPYFCRRSVIS